MTETHIMTQSRSDIRSPTLTKHVSRGIALPLPDLVGSIASGAHYSGGLSPPHSSIALPAVHHRRSLSRSGDDPAVDEAYREVLEDLKELYTGRPTAEIFEMRFAKDATFEDPLSKCHGVHEIAPQFFALPKIFSHSEQLQRRVISATFNPNHLVLAQTQEYTYRWLGTKKKINSIIMVDLDDTFHIIRLVDQWNGEDLPTRWGSAFFRRINAKLIPWLVHAPKHRHSL